MSLNLKLLSFILLFIIVNIPFTIVIVQSEGPNSPGTGTTIDLGANNPAWSNPGNITASDDSWATVSLSAGFSVSDA